MEKLGIIRNLLFMACPLLNNDNLNRNLLKKKRVNFKTESLCVPKETCLKKIEAGYFNKISSAKFLVPFSWYHQFTRHLMMIRRGTDQEDACTPTK